MSTLAIDTYRLLSALKGAGKSANYSAEEIANAIHAAQEETDVLTRTEFGVRMDSFEARMASFEARMDSFEARIDAKIDARDRPREQRGHGRAACAPRARHLTG